MPDLTAPAPTSESTQALPFCGHQRRPRPGALPHKPSSLVSASVASQELEANPGRPGPPQHGVGEPGTASTQRLELSTARDSRNQQQPRPEAACSGTLGSGLQDWSAPSWPQPASRRQRRRILCASAIAARKRHPVPSSAQLIVGAVPANKHPGGGSSVAALTFHTLAPSSSIIQRLWQPAGSSHGPPLTPVASFYLDRHAITIRTRHSVSWLGITPPKPQVAACWASAASSTAAPPKSRPRRQRGGQRRYQHHSAATESISRRPAVV